MGRMENIPDRGGILENASRQGISECNMRETFLRRVCMEAL